MERRDLKRGTWMAYDPAWLPAAEADALLGALLADTSWEQLPIVVFGREVVQPRLMAWYGALPYHYDGLTLPPRPVPPSLEELCTRVSAEAGESFNHILLNLYRDGRDHVALHADDELELGREPTIASISLGAARRFVMRPKGRHYWKRITLQHGSLLVMGGMFQHRWRHAIDKQPEVDQPRVNLTFRRLRGPPGWRPDGWRERAGAAS